MAAHRPPAESARELEESGATWLEIDSLVDQIAALAKDCPPLEQFADGLLHGTVNALAALGGAVWVRAAEDPIVGSRSDGELPANPQPVASDSPGGVRLVRAHIDPNFGATIDLSEHQALACQALTSGTVQQIPAGSSFMPPNGSTGGPRPAGCAAYAIYLAPITSMGSHPAAVLEIVQRGGLSAESQRGNLQLLSAICELAGDYFANRQLAELRIQNAFRRALDEFARHVHEAVDMDAMAYRLVNEGRRLIGCDRLTLLLVFGRKCMVTAVSGVDTVNRKARGVALIERLAAPIAAAGETVVCAESPGPASVESEMLRDYLDESPARTLMVCPVSESPPPSCETPGAASRRPLGALVLEHYSAAAPDAFRPALEHVARHAAAAIAARIPNERIPLMKTWRRIGRGLAALSLPRSALAAAAVLAIAWTLVMVEVDFTVDVEGELQPRIRRDIFAPTNGLVAELSVDDAQRVSAGSTLAVLRETGFDMEFRRVEGELATVSEQLAAVQAARLGGLPQDGPERTAPHELSAREEELRQRLAGLEEQMKVLDAARDEQIVRSPIDGQIVTWDVRRRLEMRPVSRGQVLLTVADLSGPWDLELPVSDRHAGHLLRAQSQSTEPLRVEFRAASSTAATHYGHVERIASRAETEGWPEPVVPVTVVVDGEHGETLRPGTRAFARIFCGRRAVGYVWFSDLWENLRRWLF